MHTSDLSINQRDDMDIIAIPPTQEQGMPGDFPTGPRAVPPCTPESAQRAYEDRQAARRQIDPAEAQRLRDREATELLLIFSDAVGFIGVQTFLDYIEANGLPELRRRLANMAAMAGRRS
jgi:hypothetical protein